MEVSIRKKAACLRFLLLIKYAAFVSTVITASPALFKYTPYFSTFSEYHFFLLPLQLSFLLSAQELVTHHIVLPITK